MTTKVTIEVPRGADYRAEVEVQYTPRGPNDDGVQRAVVKPGDTLSFYVYGPIRVKSIREVPL